MRLFKCIGKDFYPYPLNSVWQEDHFKIPGEVDNVAFKMDFEEVDVNNKYYICNSDKWMGLEKGKVYESSTIPDNCRVAMICDLAITCPQDFMPISFVAKEKQTVGELNNVKNALDVQVGGNHYKDFAIQPVEFCMKNNIGFVAGSIIKYLLRKKGDKSKRIEDLNKAKHLLEILIQFESKD